VWLYTWNVLDPALPFGGRGDSGWGREMGREGLEAHLETMTVVADLATGPARAPDRRWPR
jgi:phenylacetaldehyde dehydrogenase